MKRTLIAFVFIFYFILNYFAPRLFAEPELIVSSSEPSISLDFQDANLKDVLKVFSMQSGLNFIASESVQDRKVTLYLDKAPLSLAMDKIFSANNLSYELDRQANIIVVKEWGKMGTETVTKVFYLKNATVSTASLKEELSKNSALTGVDTSTTNSRSKYKEEDEGGISSAVKKLLSPSPVGSLIEDFRTNSLIITDTPMKMKVISQVIASLDVAVPQVILEVEMLDVSKDVVDKMGFKFGDTPFTAIITGATASMGFPYAGWTKIFSGGDGSIAINSGTNTYQMQLDFMRTQTDTKFLARPKLLTLNNETAEIAITKDEIVSREDTTVFNQGGTPTTTSVYKRSTDMKLTKEGTGIFLRVTPQINMDTNEITMVVNPKSSVTFLSSLSTIANLQKDIEVRSSKSIVKVKDGETVVLGGLIHYDKSVESKNLPVLSTIPILGALFRHKDQTKDIEREIVVFITPRIVRDSPETKQLAQINNFELPLREQNTVNPGNRDYLVNASLNNFDRKR